MIVKNRIYTRDFYPSTILVKVLKKAFNFENMETIFHIGQKQDIFEFFRKGIEINKMNELCFNNKIIENLNERFLSYVNKFIVSDLKEYKTLWVKSVKVNHIDDLSIK